MASFEISQLRTLIAVIEAGSLTAAAPRLFLSQSAVSEQIKKLEEYVGESLLVRSKFGVTPTSCGSQMLVHAKHIVAMAEAALQDVRGETLRGRIHLAVTDYFKPSSLTRLLKQMSDTHSGIRLQVSVLRSADVVLAVASGLCDLGLVMSLDQSRTRMQKIGIQEPLVWATAPGWQPLKDEPLPLLMLPESCAIHQLAIKELGKKSISYRVAHQASGVAGLQSAIAAGLGIACINQCAMGDGAVQALSSLKLPKLPKVWFGLLPAQRKEPDVVQQMRQLLVQQWAF